MDGRRALVFGATGLVGKLLTDQLIQSDDYTAIRIFTRKPSAMGGMKKIEEIIVDFDRLEEISEKIVGDDLFICLGTTIRKAGSVKKMEEIDRDLPVRIASVAHGNGVKRAAIVSSLGASCKSSNYYLRIKGEMEESIRKIGFRTIIIARPSLLLGERNEKRAGESVSKIAMKLIGKLLTGKLSKYRAIEGGDVAKAMIKAIVVQEGINVLESDRLSKLAAE